MKIRIAIFLCLSCAVPAMGQFGGPYDILARDTTGILHVSPGLLSRYTSFHHLAGPTGGVNLDITSILVDRYDTYWFGSSTGLIRMDGGRLTHYLHDPENEASLPSDHVTSLTAGPYDDLWVGTRSGLYRIDLSTGHTQRISLRSHNTGEMSARHIIGTVFHSNKLWCSTWDGLYRLDPASLESDKMMPAAVLDRPPRSSGAFVTGTVYPSDGGHPVIGTTSGIVRMDPITGTTREFSPAIGDGIAQPTQLFPAHSGRIWCYDRISERVYLLDSLAGVVDTLPLLPGRSSYASLQQIYDDGSGLLWISFQRGDPYAFEMAPKSAYKLQFVVSAQEREGNAGVKVFYNDPKGRLWLGGGSGAMVLLPIGPGIGAEAVPELGHSIMCMTQDRSGDLFIGTRGDGIRYRDANSGAWHIARDVSTPAGSKASLRRNTVFEIQHLDGPLYFIATLAGPMLYDRTFDSFTPVIQDDVLSNAAVVSCAVSRNGKIWLATMTNGLYEIELTSWRVLRHFTPQNDSLHLPGHTIGTIRTDEHDNLWVGLHKDEGLFILKPGSNVLEQVRPEHGQSVGGINALNFDIPGRLLISTMQDGAVIMDRNGPQFKRFTMSAGLPGADVRSIAGHAELGIWFGGKGGVAWLNSNGHHVVTAQLRMTQDHYSGILHLDTHGEQLWIADGKRLFNLDLFRHEKEREPPQVLLLNTRVNATNVDDIATARLTAGRDRLVFNISVQDPLLADRTRIAYRLLPEVDWEDCIGCREIVYAELPAGEHQLELRAMHPDGIWGPIAVTSEFKVLPPFWQTWWALGLSAIFLLLVTFTIFQWRIARRTARIRARFENERALSDERLRIANDLHDELGSGLSVIKVKSELAIERPGSHPSGETLRQIAESSTDLIHAMRQVIWTIRSGQPKLSDLTAYMRSYAAGYLNDHDIQCSFSVPEFLHDRELSVDQRRALLLIMKEALHNVVKHSGARNVSIEISNGSVLRMRIADDGSGFDPATMDRTGEHLGLPSMQQRARSIGGLLHVQRSNGTIITLELPLSAPGPNVPFQSEGPRPTFVTAE